MSAEAAFTRSWPVGRYTATLVAPTIKRGSVASAVIEWSPEVPQRLTHDEIDAYRKGRDAALAELGLRTMVIEA